MDSTTALSTASTTANWRRFNGHASRMQYRRRPVSVAVDPISLVISECIAVTSALQKHARSPHHYSSVSAILGGGGPNLLQLGGTNPSSIRSPRGGNNKASSGGAGGGRPSTGGATDDDVGSANRWGLRGQKGKSMQDNPLISGFGRLRQDLTGVQDIYTFDALHLLSPFLQVIQAKGTVAPVTILALRAIQKFLSYGFIAPDSPRFDLALQSLSAAITHCQFDISDPHQEEVVLLIILQLMEDMLSGPGGDILSDESVCDMMGRGLTICSRSRFSEVLRRTAEATMVRMCQVIFEDLKHLEVEAGDESDALDKQTDGDMDNVKMDPAANGTDVPLTPDPTAVSAATEATGAATAATTAAAAATPRDSFATEVASSSGTANGAGEAGRSSTSSSTEDGSVSVDLRPYSLPSVRELFRVLVNFLDPHDRKQPDQMRVMALRIIHVALEVAGPSIARHPALAAIAEDQLCCHLFQLVRSDNMSILQEALIVAGTLLSTCRGVLKLQQELYLSYLITCLYPSVDIPREPGIDPSLYAGIPQSPKLIKPAPSQPNSGRATPVPVKERQKLGMEGGARKPEARQAMVENIGVLARVPTFMVELFVNYDCDENRTDLCEDLIGLLSRNALPDSATWSTTSVPPLCLDALLRFVQFMAERIHVAPVTEGYPSPEELRARRQRKRLIVKGTAKFNESPKGGLAYLQESGVIDNASDPYSVAKFLKGTSRINKKVLGDFLTKKGSEEILDAFMDQFDFEGKRVDEALRVLLQAFRLPGEAPLISRIVTSFSDKYCAGAPPEGIADKDAVFILTYAIIMLNTDQHNPNVKGQARMTVTDFARNLRGQNGGKDFAPEYLQEIYDAIKSNEIILAEEHDNKHAFDQAWKELLLKTESAGPLTICNTNIYDADMFAATWKPIVATLSYVFMSATDDTVYTRVFAGFHECARIAARYGNTEALDQIIYCLSLMTTLSSGPLSSTALNTEVPVDDDGNKVMVSELAVKFGRDARAQYAILLLFRVVKENEHVIRKSWKHIIRIWLNLFVNSLIPPFFSDDESKLALPPIPLHNPNRVVDRAAKVNEASFFSAFTSYISSYAADDPPEPSDEELESTIVTVDSINQCDMGAVFANISKLPEESLEALVEALLDEIPDDPDNNGTFTLIAASNGENAPSSPANGQKAKSGPVYDPGMVYILELCTTLALRDEKTIKLLGQRVVAVLQAILRDVGNYHPILVGRITFYLFRLLQAGYDHDYVRVPVLLHNISSFPKDLLHKTSSPVLQGLKLCIDQPGPLRNEIMTSPDFWVILETLSSHSASAATVFDILESGISGSPPAIMADNYEAAVKLLNSFASAAASSVTPSRHQSKGPQHRNPRAPTKPKQSEKSTTTTISPAVSRGIKAVTIIYSMTTRIPELMSQSHLESSEAWSAYWLPIFQALTTQCTNPCREVRHLAFSSLTRSLLSPELVTSSADHKEWTAIFGEVLFPLILRLLKPEVFSSDRDGMSETRVQAASLLCKVFLQYLVLLSEWEGMLDLWVRIIEIMDRLMNSGQGDSLEEAVPENLKNILLFMASSGYLVSPQKDPSKEKLWTETWKRIDRFLPELRGELALEEEEVQEPEKKEAEVEQVVAVPVGDVEAVKEEGEKKA